MNMPLAARNCLVRASLILLAMLLCAGRAHGAPQGELDATFGENGRLAIGPKYEVTFGGSVAQQLVDGKLLVAGTTWVTPSGWFDFIVFRLHADGSPDDGFGTNGAVLIDFEGLNDIATDVAVQPDSKIVVAGYAKTGEANFDIALSRLNQDGSIDSTFGINGRVTLDLGGGDEYTAKMVLLPNGKIVIAGATNAGGDYDAFFARFEANGSLDTTFGTGSIAGTTQIDSNGIQDQPYWMTIQPDGKFIACGQSGPRAYDATGGQVLAIRVNSNGSVDPGFGTNGVSLIATGAPLGGGRGCVAMPDGTTVLAGFTGNTGNEDLLLVRLASNGAQDTSFGTAGYSRINLGGSESAQSIIRLADGNLGVTGLTSALNNEVFGTDPLWAYNIPSSYSDTLVARIDPNSGLLDPEFGNNGATLIDFGEPGLPSRAFGRGLIQQADGKLLVVGASGAWGDWWNYHQIALARVDPAGTGNAGRVGFVDTNSRVTEGNAGAVISVRRTGGSTGIFSVDYNTVAASAIVPGDFTATSGTLTWLSGDMDPKSITVPITDDNTVEDVEWFSIELSNANGYLGFAEISVFINNDDLPQGGGGSGGGGSGGGGGGATGIEAPLLGLIWAIAARRRRDGLHRAFS